MQKIYLIRHGETEWNKQLRYQGQKDVPLNDEGHRQAMLLARFLEKENIEVIYSSPLLRARETAMVITSKRDIKLQLEEGFLEINFGEWEGRRYTDLNEEQRQVAACWYNTPESVCIPGGEPFLAFRQRILNTYNHIIKTNKDKNIGIITHAGVIRVIISSVLEMPEGILARLRLSPASLSIVLYDDWGNSYLELLNGTCHLHLINR